MTVQNPTPVSPASVHVDAALSDFATSYANKGFIADLLSPIIPVNKRSDKFFIRTRRDVSHVSLDLMGPKSKANEATYEVSTDNYSVQDRGLMDYVSNALERNADAPLSPEQLAVNNLMQRLMLAREQRVATLLCTSGNYASGNTSAAGAVWTNTSTSTPIADINGAMAAIPFSGEDTRLVAWCAREVWNALRKHPELLALKGLASSGQVSRQEFAAFFELDDILVSDVWADTANIGQSASYARCFTATQFGILRVPRVVSGPDVSMFCGTFRVSPPGIQTYTWDEPAIGVEGSRGIRTSFADDEKIIQSDMGYLLTGVA